MIKTILLIGATGGLGEAMVAQFKNPQTRLIMVGRNIEKLQHLQEKWIADYAKIDVLVLDIGETNSREQLISQLKAESIDVFIYNAGFGLFQNAEEFNDTDINEMLQVNTLGAIQLTSGLLPQFYDQQKGHIIFIASQAGKIATAKSSVYSASKFALIGYANALRLEARVHNVWVTTVNPGPIATDFFKRADVSGNYVKAVGKYMLHPEDVAKRITKVIKKPKREVNMPMLMNWLAKWSVVFPNISDRVTYRLFNKK